MHFSYGALGLADVTLQAADYTSIGRILVDAVKLQRIALQVEEFPPWLHGLFAGARRAHAVRVVVNELVL